MQIAVLPEVFHGDGAHDRLCQRLEAARAQGAELVVLPELPLDPWIPGRDQARDEDAEGHGGPRYVLAQSAAEATGLALIAGAIVRDPSGTRHNTAWAFDATGVHLASYRKVHLPHEPWFWEKSHYAPGTEPPDVFDLAGVRLGLQICSDVNRPEGSLMLGAAGAQVIAAPRATEPMFYPRWKLVLRANAITACTYVVCVNRPPEAGAKLGGPSLVIAPDGEVVCETDTLTTVPMDIQRVDQAKNRYPGYLQWFPEVYQRGWGRSAGST